VNAALCRRYDTGHAAGVLKRARSLVRFGGPIAVTAALAVMERALRGGAPDGIEGAAYGLTEAVRAHFGDDAAAYVRGEDGGRS
jgi:hypothetical protein